MLKILNVIVIGFLAIPLSSFGAVITYTSDVFSGSILEGGLYGRIGVTMSVPQFNPALGNLNNINFLQVPSIVTAVITVGGSINFFSGICLEGSALLLIRVTSSSSLFLSQGLENRVAAVSNRRCDQDDVSTHIIPFPVFFYIPQVDLSPFIGTGSVSIPLELRSELRVEDSWTRVGMRSLDWTGNAEITYNYQPTPTPEGSSLSLTLFGLGILFAANTRKALNRNVSL